MIDGIPVPIGVLAPAGLLGLAVLLILTGRLVPRRTYDDKAHEANEWRAESRVKDQHINELADQNKMLLREIAPTINAALGALREASTQPERES